MSYQRAGHAGGGRNPQTCQIYAGNQGAPCLWGTGYWQTDQGVKPGRTDYCRNAGKGDGPLKAAYHQDFPY